MSPYKFIVNTL